MDSSDPVVVSGTVGTTLVDVAVINRRGRATFARRGVFSHGDAANDLLVSFDDGVTWTTAFHSKEPLRIEAMFNRFQVKSSAATVAWSAVLSVA